MSDHAPTPPSSGPTPPATEGGKPAGGDGGGNEPPISINAQYLKDLSFEAPAVPGVFAMMQRTEPAIEVNIDVEARNMQGPLYEVMLRFRARCKVGETVAFIVELDYGGLFTVRAPDEHLQPILLIECPRILFPFARYILADATRDGGFPPLLVGPVDFVGMFHQRMARAQAAAKAPQGKA